MSNFYFTILPAEVGRIILSKLVLKGLRNFADTGVIALNSNDYKELVRIKDSELYNSIQKVISKSYYSDLGDIIYQVVYNDDLVKINSILNCLWEPRYHEKVSDITSDIVYLIKLYRGYRYTFNNLNTLDKYKGLAEVTYAILEYRESSASKQEDDDFLDYLNTGELKNTLKINIKFFQYEHVADVLTMYLIIKLDSEKILFEKDTTGYLIKRFDKVPKGGESIEILLDFYPELYNHMAIFIKSMQDKVRTIS